MVFIEIRKSFLIYIVFIDDFKHLIKIRVLVFELNIKIKNNVNVKMIIIDFNCIGKFIKNKIHR